MSPTWIWFLMFHGDISDIVCDMDYGMNGQHQTCFNDCGLMLMD